MTETNPISEKEIAEAKALFDSVANKAKEFYQLKSYVEKMRSLQEEIAEHVRNNKMRMQDTLKRIKELQKISTQLSIQDAQIFVTPDLFSGLIELRFEKVAKMSTQATKEDILENNLIGQIDSLINRVDTDNRLLENITPEEIQIIQDAILLCQKKLKDIEAKERMVETLGEQLLMNCQKEDGEGKKKRDRAEEDFRQSAQKLNLLETSLLPPESAIVSDQDNFLTTVAERMQLYTIGLNQLTREGQQILDDPFVVRSSSTALLVDPYTVNHIFPLINPHAAAKKPELLSIINSLNHLGALLIRPRPKNNQPRKIELRGGPLEMNIFGSIDSDGVFVQAEN